MLNGLRDDYETFKIVVLKPLIYLSVVLQLINFNLRNNFIVDKTNADLFYTNKRNKRKFYKKNRVKRSSTYFNSKENEFKPHNSNDN